MEGNDPENVDTPTDNPTKVDTETQPNQDQPSQDNANKTPTGPAANQTATNSGYWAEKRSRIGVLAAIFCFFCLLAFAYWFNADKQASGFKQGFGFCAAGLFFIFLSIIATFVILFLNKEIRIIDFVVIIVYIGGAVLYFIGGCVNAGTINNDSDDTGLAAVYFGEATLITLYACLIAFDYWRSVCGPKGRRIFIHFVALGFGSLILFFGYATIKILSFNSLQCIAAGYFFILLAIILYLVVNMCLKNMPIVIAKHSVIEFTIACILIFGGFIACVGYWAFADDISPYSEGQAYEVSYGFFILFVTIYIGIDIKLEDYLPKRKT